jgi:hypothetical protein
MNMPQFTAEASLGSSANRYRTTIRLGDADNGEVSMQQFSGFQFDHIFGTKLTCCKADDGTRPLFCRTRIVFPFESCSCAHDFDGFPIFNCSSLIALPRFV